MINSFRLSGNRLLSYIALFILFASNLFAQDDSLFTITIPHLNGSIKIDGFLNDDAWKEATSIKQFYSYRPVDGQPAEEKTAVLLGYSQSSLYIAFICFDSAPSNIRATICNRDEISDDDYIEIFLDTFNRGKEAYLFSFNPYGIQADGIYIDMGDIDYTPDYIQYSEGRLFSKGYIVEVEIPFKSLRFPKTEKMEWGIMIGRRIWHRDQDNVWPAISRNSTTFISQFGKLFGLEDINSGNNIEILPEFTATRYGEVDFDTGKFEEEDIDPQLGVNLKVGFLSDLTLDLAYNPDFSQVEANPDLIDVNRRFPLYYEEKRPFFLEGTTIFQTPLQVLYTRRLVNPLIAAKLTGNLGRGYEIGLLGDVDEFYGSDEFLTEKATEFSQIDSTFDDSTFLNTYKNEKSFHTILRLRKEIYEYSKMGAIYSDYRLKDAFSRTYGIDGDLIIAGDYSLTFQALHSETNDLMLNYKNDPAFFLNLFRGSRTFNFQLFYKDVFPDFEMVNGFQERDPDYREIGAQFWYDIRSENSFVYLIRPNFYVTQMYDHDQNDPIKNGKKIESYIAPSLSLMTLGQISLSGSYFREFEDYLGYGFDLNQYLVNVSSRTIPWFYVFGYFFWGDGIYYDAVYYDREPFLGYTHTINWGFEFKPISQWATRLSGNHYVFKGNDGLFKAHVNQDILRLRTVFQFTREIYLRVILEQNNYYKDLDVNILAGWEPSPGTVLFLGYNDYYTRDLSLLNSLGKTSREYTRFARGLFFKFSYLIRL
jgi:hypothetical protein